MKPHDVKVGMHGRFAGQLVTVVAVRKMTGDRWWIDLKALKRAHLSFLLRVNPDTFDLLVVKGDLWLDRPPPYGDESSEAS